MAGTTVNMLGMRSALPTAAGTQGEIITFTGSGSAWSAPALRVIDVSAVASDLAGGGVSVLIPGDGSKQYIIRDMWINLSGTNFSGGLGDRDITISDGSVAWTTIPAGTLASLINASWGTTLVMPFPDGDSVSAVSQPGQDIRALYTGGTTDYDVGNVLISILYETLPVGPPP